MPAFWELLAYRVDGARLIGLVGSGDEFRQHAKRILRSTRGREIQEEDDRLEPPGLEAALEEIARGGKALTAEHSTAYRIAVEAIAENLATKIRSIAGYADRSRLPEALRALGLTVLAKAFDALDGLRFPWKKKGAVVEEWPWATFLDRPSLARACEEITNLVCRGDHINASRARWCSKKNLIVEVKNKRSGARSKDVKLALITPKGVLATGALDEVLASVPTADFESATMALAPNAPSRVWCPALRRADRERLKATLIEELKLSEYDGDLIDCTLALLEIVRSYADGDDERVTQTKKPLTSANEKNGLLLFADGERG